jgi:hypothetical protein
VKPLKGSWLAVLALAALGASALLWADDAGAFQGEILLEYVGQVINGTPTPASSNQFGNLQGVAGMDPSLAIHLLHAGHDGQSRRQWTTADHRPNRYDHDLFCFDTGDFSNPDSFRSRTPVQVSTLRQQVIVDNSTGTFMVVNINTITTAAQFVSDGKDTQLGEVGQSFQTRLSGHLNAPGTSPAGWFGGYAVGNRS